MGWQELCAIGLVPAQLISQNPCSKIHLSRDRAGMGLEPCEKQVNSPIIND